MNRRTYVSAILACLVGAGVTLYAVTRTWSLSVIERPGLSDLREARTGADIEPWLIGLALVALAGAGAMPAVRGRVRRGLGALLALVGAGIVAGAVTGRAGLDVGRAGAGALVWPVACALGGAIILCGGVAAARHGHLWPAMSSRYERRTVPSAADDVAGGSRPSPAAGRERGETSPAAQPMHADETSRSEEASAATQPMLADKTSRGEEASVPAPAPSRLVDQDPVRLVDDHVTDARAAWDALDRGDDPTDC